MKDKIVLAYSGGLDTSVAVQWLIDKGYDVVACCLDVGEGKRFRRCISKALDIWVQSNVILLMQLKNLVMIM